MELKEFISSTLTQIADGVRDAINKSAEKGYLVNPSSTKSSDTYTVHFDLCVEAGKEGNADIKVLGANISEKSTNRISFDVDMSYPASGEIPAPKRPVY